MNKNELIFEGVDDWAQGEVTQLYSKISENGYQILYLSARSIRNIISKKISRFTKQPLLEIR